MRVLPVIALALAACRAEPLSTPIAPAAPVKHAKLLPYPAGAGPEVPRWQIGSDPPNASIWVDGVDTGARTPAEFIAPPEGRYSIRLSLAGYADDTTEISQQAGSGLFFGRHLRPKAIVAREEASRIAAQRPVDERAREATRRFLGADTKRARVVLERSASIGVPELSITISGDGTAKASWTSDDRTERVVPLQLGAEEIRRIFEALVAQGFADIVCAERPGIPDEVSFRVTVTNASGESRSAEKWSGDPHPRFDPVLEELRSASAKLPADVKREIGWGR